MRHVVDGKRVKAKSPADVLKPGDVVFVETEGRRRRLHAAPAAGSRGRAWSRWTRIPAACSPWSAASPIAQSEFNRATQAYAPAGLVVQAVRLCGGARQRLHAVLGGDGRADRPSGSATRSGRRRTTAASSAGPSTLRTGIEQSRNMMTVRLAKDMGMPLVAEYAERFGIYDNMAPLSADGAGLRRDDGACAWCRPIR